MVALDWASNAVITHFGTNVGKKSDSEERKVENHEETINWASQC